MLLELWHLFIFLFGLALVNLLFYEFTLFTFRCFRLSAFRVGALIFNYSDGLLRVVILIIPTIYQSVVLQRIFSLMLGPTFSLLNCSYPTIKTSCWFQETTVSPCLTRQTLFGAISLD